MNNNILLLLTTSPDSPGDGSKMAAWKTKSMLQPRQENLIYEREHHRTGTSIYATNSNNFMTSTHTSDLLLHLLISITDTVTWLCNDVIAVINDTSSFMCVTVFGNWKTKMSQYRSTNERVVQLDAEPIMAKKTSFSSSCFCQIF